MKDTLSYIALGCAIIPFFITVSQFIIFFVNNKKYNTLLYMFHEREFELPPLYKFYEAMGFFGSFGMAYFFSRLKKKKKIIFQPKEHNAISNFLVGIDFNLTRWIDIYYHISLSALFLYTIFVVMSLIKIAAMQLQ